ncbi:hypothetical protein F5Y14DRAFT_270281 [Nemania sp. NC0429]|nr:hypothetical protein F5Y14DRAFT_270281 [Nemania sp. NC0429]
MEPVLAIPELLEAILLQLDMTSLLLSASRVNKTWNHVIETSPAIQKALYFQPVQDNCSTQNPKQKPTAPTVNPLLLKKFGAYFFAADEHHGRVHRACDAFHKLPWEENRGIDLATTLEMQRAITSQKRDCSRFTRTGASWRRMLVSQPPPTELGALWQEAGLSSAIKPMQTAFQALIVPGTSMHPTGIQMGHLYDLVQYYAGHHQRDELWYRVVWNSVKLPTYSGFLRDECKGLLHRTPLVVELYDVADSRMGTDAREPSDLEAFDSTFQCEESSEPNAPWTQIQSRGFDFEAWIFRRD